MILGGVQFSDDIFPGELITSLIIMAVIAIFSFIVYFKSKKVDPLKKPKGIMLLAEMYVKMMDDLVCKNMGKQYRKIGGGIFGFLSAYLFLCMIIGLLGFESPVTYLYVPLSLGLSTFILIHATAAFYNRKQYFQRYVDPVWAFLPINLLSMWAPLLSISLRLFGNGIAGYVVLKLVYWAFENITIGVVSLAPAAVVVTPFLHAYFDIVSGFIQTMVYTLLSMALVKNEVPEDIANKLDKEYEQEVTRINKILDGNTK